MPTHQSDPNYNQAMPDTNPTGRSPREAQRPKRPLPLKLIWWIFTLWSLLGWLRFAGAVAGRELIVNRVGPALFAYLLLAGLTWGLLGLPVLWGLLRRASWTPALLKAAGVLYPALYWLERLLLWQDPHAHRNWPLMLLLTLAWAGLVLWGLRSAQARGFFDNEQDQERG